jgi:hypothetical protein
MARDPNSQAGGLHHLTQTGTNVSVMQDMQFLVWLTKAAGLQSVSAAARTSLGLSGYFSVI